MNNTNNTTPAYENVYGSELKVGDVIYNPSGKNVVVRDLDSAGGSILVNHTYRNGREGFNVGRDWFVTRFAKNYA